MMRGWGSGNNRPLGQAVSFTVVRNQDQASKYEYEDKVVYVTKGQPKRGRPRRSVATLALPPPQRQRETQQQQLQREVQRQPQRFPRSDQVIYVSAVRGRSQNVRQTQRTATPQLSVSTRPLRCLVTGIPSTGQKIVNIHKPVVNLALKRTCAEVKLQWPLDLMHLVSTWDSLPEMRMREVVMWLGPNNSVDQPHTVKAIQQFWSEEPGNWQAKVDVALEVLRKMEPPDSPLASVLLPKPEETKPASTISQFDGIAASPVNRAKVLVEVQPNHIQDWNQWSSVMYN